MLVFFTKNSPCAPIYTQVAVYQNKHILQYVFTHWITYCFVMQQRKKVNWWILTEPCTGLKTKWITTMETTAVFPVDPGTSVEVKCSDSRFSNAGSSKVICITRTEFIYLTGEPWCTTEGNLKKKYDNIFFPLVYTLVC